MINQQLKFILVQGPEGFSLYLNRVRIAGPKLANGGKVLHEWTVETRDLLYAVNESTKVVSTVASVALDNLRSKGRAALGRLSKMKVKPKAQSK